MTGADVASIMNATSRDGFLEGNGIIILILFFLIFGFGGGAWGNSGNALTQSELQMGLYNQTTDRNLSDIRDGIALTNQNVSTTGCGISKEILESRYNDSLLSNQLSRQLSECCCENRLAIANQTSQLQATMTANTQAILDKMCETEIQNLRDSVAGYRETLNSANQTQNILGQLGRFYINNPIGYYGAYGYNGTTII